MRPPVSKGSVRFRLIQDPGEPWKVKRGLVGKNTKPPGRHDRPPGGSAHQLPGAGGLRPPFLDRKSTRLNSSHSQISYAVFCLKKKKIKAEIAQVSIVTNAPASVIHNAATEVPS